MLLRFLSAARLPVYLDPEDIYSLERSEDGDVLVCLRPDRGDTWPLALTGDIDAIAARINRALAGELEMEL